MDLEQRVAKLERSNRRLMVLLGVVVCLGSGLGAMAFNPPDNAEFRVVKAESFVVSDGEGRVLANLSSSKPKPGGWVYPQGSLFLAGKEDDGKSLTWSRYVPGVEAVHETDPLDR